MTFQPDPDSFYAAVERAPYEICVPHGMCAGDRVIARGTGVRGTVIRIGSCRRTLEVVWDDGAMPWCGVVPWAFEVEI